MQAVGKYRGAHVISIFKLQPKWIIFHSNCKKDSGYYENHNPHPDVHSRNLMCYTANRREHSSSTNWANVKAGAIGVIGALIALPTGVSTLGFTSQGVAATSHAAAWQNGIGNVTAGYLFANLQSAGKYGMVMYVMFCLAFVWNTDQTISKSPNHCIKPLFKDELNCCLG